MALYEVLIGRTGRVERVWTLREPDCQPAWPEFGEAMRAAVAQRRYEPATLAGKSVPTCAVASISIRWE